MSGSLSKEQRRNVRKALGDTAVDAVEEARKDAATLALQHRVLAKEHLTLSNTLKEATERLDGRLNTVVAWCDKNEQRIAAHEARTAYEQQVYLQVVENIIRELRDHREAREQFEALGFWRRLRWLFRGFPPLPSTVGEPADDAGTQAPRAGAEVLP